VQWPTVSAAPNNHAEKTNDAWNRLFLKQVGLAPKQALTTQCRICEGPVAEGQHGHGSGVRQRLQSLAQFITVFRRLTLQSPSEVARVGSSQKSFLPKERAIRP